jgi:hypothetical protein
MATPRILGLPFDSGVDAQVKIRQKQLSVRNRLDNTQQQDNLVVFNSSTSFVRLSSAVSVDGAERLNTLKNNLGLNPGDITGYELAKNLVLWGGVNIAQLPRGIGYDLNSTYGFLSDGAQGLKPLPGITSMTSNYKNNGSLREVTLNIKCFTRKQFEAIEAVYLRLGYTMVVEWGHTDYFSNDGIKSQTTGASILSLLYPGTKSDKIEPITIQNKLNENKKNTSYNYDGALSRVTNFSWNLKSDLSYDITLYLISWGDIIDSLKLNIANSVSNGLRIDPESSKGISATLINTVNNKSLSSLNTLFYQMYEMLVKDRISTSGLSTETTTTIKNLDIIQAQTDQISEAKLILIDIVNRYLSLTETYYNSNSSSITVENLDSLNRFKSTLTNLNNSINSLSNLTDFQNLTGYSPSEIIKGVENIGLSKEATVTVEDVSVGVIKTNILKNYQTQVFNTDFQNYIEDRIEPVGYRITL